MLKIRRAAAGAGAMLAAVGLLIAVPASADAAIGTVLVPEPVCAAPVRGAASCFAIRLARVPATSRAARRYALAHDGAVARPAAAGGPAGGYTPAQLANAYGVNRAASAAAKQTVAIIDAFGDPTVRADLNAFDAHYGLPAETSSSLRVVNQSGQAAPLPAANDGWATETSIDVQTVRGLCQKCRILLVEATDAGPANVIAAVNRAAAMHATVISNSYGFPEDVFDGDASLAASVRKAYAHPGIVITAATGDDGWYDWDNRNDGAFSLGVVHVPATLPTVIGVGGTSLYLNPDGTRALETAWNANGPSDEYGRAENAALGAAGSGCSARYAAPRWEASVSGYGALGCATGKRSEVDIAADGDPQTGFDVFQTVSGHGTWTTYGGTSLSAPIIAALFALEGGAHGVRYPALTLYGHFKGHAGRDTYDVRVGGTGACATSSTTTCAKKFGGNPNEEGFGLLDCAFPTSGSGTLAHRGQCYAGPGYDGVSGVGTPKGLTTFAPIGPHAVIVNPGRVRHLFSKRFSASGTSDPFPGGTITSYRWNWGDGHTSSGTHPTHRYTRKATRIVTLTVTDSYGRKGTAHRKIVVR